MSINYKDLLNKLDYNLHSRFPGYVMDLTPRYNKVVGNVQPGIYTAISGFPGSGKTSFTY